MNLDELLDATYRTKYIDQNSEEWENIRAGRFTSSEFWKLMEFGKRPMTEAELKARPKEGKGSQTKLIPDPSTMSEKGMTYIYQKVAEVLTGRPKPSAYAYPLVFGKEQEPFAVAQFEQVTGLICTEVGFQPYTDHAGGSPDRLIGEHSGLECKCPFNSETQVEYLMLNDVFDLKRNHPDHYWQCVSQMLFTGRDHWYFATYDGRMQEERHKLFLLELSTNTQMIREDMELIPIALAAAVKHKLELLQLLKS